MKLAHYFEHALLSEFGPNTKAYLPSDTRWLGHDIWTQHRHLTVREIDWDSVAVLVISGLGWERFVPARFRREPPFRVVYLLQSFERLLPTDSQYRHLANPAVRICVSKPLEVTLRALNLANGPVHTIPACLDLSELSPSGQRDIDLLILGSKQPRLAHRLAQLAERSGIHPTAFIEQTDRESFLSGISRARIAVCLPDTREGFYLPALEAMALGTLVVCPDVDGNAYCIDGYNCIKPIYRVARLMDAVLKAKSMPNATLQTMLENARATAARHDLHRERAEFQKLLRELMHTASEYAT